MVMSFYSYYLKNNKINLYNQTYLLSYPLKIKIIWINYYLISISS